MSQMIVTIDLRGALIGVNCYLVKADAGYVLIDTGISSKRADLEGRLEAAGCRPGDLRLILLTHGDTDHAGNAAYLRQKYGGQIAMHQGELEAVESGDMFRSRKPGGFLAWMVRKAITALFPLDKADRFRPDVCVVDEQGLSDHGLAARVLHIPGHSMGSIGVLTDDGDLFCGDLLTNTNKPGPSPIVDDRTELVTSLERLKALGIKTVYPGHGRPFPMEAFTK